MPDLRLDDVTLHYEIDGEGPPLVLLAGLLSDSASWGPLVEPLARDLTVIRPDNRTTGRTVPWDAPASLAAMAGDVLALLDHLGHDSVHLAGHSMGGMLALEIAGRAPERVGTLSLIATTQARLPRTQAMFETMLDIRRQPGGEELWLRALYPWVFAPRFFDRPENTRIALDAALAYPHAQSADAMAHQVAMIGAARPHVDLASLTMPTQAIYAELDLVTPPDSARERFETIPGAEHHVIEGAGHSIHWDAPAEVLARLADFLARHPLDAAGGPP